MSDFPPEDDFIAAYARYLDREGPEPDIRAVPVERRRDIARKAQLLRSGHEVLAGFSDLENDPVFANLGFDRVGEDIEIGGRSLKRARQLAKLQITDVAQRIHHAGSTLTAKDLFNIELATSTPVQQADASALAAALAAPIAALQAKAARLPAIRQFLQSPLFERTIQQWSVAHQRNSEVTMRAARTALLSANYRGGEHAQDHVFVEMLNTILERLGDE